MLSSSRKLPKHLSPLIFGIIQSCITSAVAAGISHSGDPSAEFVGQWVRTWLLSWITIVPIVLLAAPAIRRVVEHLTDETG